MTSADAGTVLFYTGLFLMFLGVTGLLLHRWEAELKQALPRYRKPNRVEEGDRR